MAADKMYGEPLLSPEPLEPPTSGLTCRRRKTGEEWPVNVWKRFIEI